MELGLGPRYPWGMQDVPSYDDPSVRKLRADLALALRAADHHGLSEGICNHFSMALPHAPDIFLLNPRGFHWSEIGEDDIVMVDADGRKLAGKHEVEPTAMYIHAAVHRIAKKACVMHTHMPYATALGCTRGVPFDTTLSQSAMSFHGRVAVDGNYSGLALDVSEGERIAKAMNGADIVFLANHGVIVCGDRIDYAYNDLYYLERACQVQMIAAASGVPLAPVSANLAGHVAAQSMQERLQSELFFESLRRRLK